MATKISTVITMVRGQLREATARFWQDQDLIDIMRLGAIDLWGAILDLHQDHYFTVNDKDVYLRANATQLSGIPPDCFRITLLEPRDTTVDGTGHQVLFVPRKYNHPDFIIARTLAAADPDALPSRQIYYQITGEGSPIAPPVVRTAPMLSADLPVRICYNQTLAWEAGQSPQDGIVPIPGDVDNALKAWTIAYARAWETDDKQPDPGWLGVYATEKQTALTRLTPREEQEPEVVEDLFQGYGSLW